MNKEIRLNLTDKRDLDENGEPRFETFYSKEGLKEFVEYLDSTRERLIEETIHVSIDKNEVPVEIALQYNSSYSENIHSYVNNINTIEGGTHSNRFPSWINQNIKNIC